MANIHTITGITGTRVADGRVPTLNERGANPAPRVDLEGSTSMKVSPSGVLGGGNNAQGPNAAAINKMIARNASSFRNDVVKRNNKIKARRGKACD